MIVYYIFHGCLHLWGNASQDRNNIWPSPQCGKIQMKQVQQV